MWDCTQIPVCVGVGVFVGPKCVSLLCRVIAACAAAGGQNFGLYGYCGQRGRWSRILKTAQDALENRLAELHCVDEIHAFALRCIKDDHLREVYLSFCVEDISEFALPAETVHNVVFSSEEHPNFHKDLELFEQSKTPASTTSKSFCGE